MGDRRHRPVGADQLRPASARLDSRSRYLMARVHRWEPYRDGIGAVVSQTNQPERLAVFLNGDVWLTYNLARNPAALAS